MRISVWSLLTLGLAVIVMLPLIAVFSSWSHIDSPIWAHLAQVVLPELLVNTLYLVIGVGIGVTILGVGLAWLTSMCDFPGRRFFDWALVLPFVLPSYVLAFVVLGLFDFSGPVQSALRQWFTPKGYYFPQINSTGGVITVMTLSLYPYVYMLARSAFINQGRSAFEAARGLGLSPWQTFYKVNVPIARPAIIAGLSLALMEVLADFGTVAVFNYDTFTTAIYKTWFSLFDLRAASQLASLLLILVLLLLSLEKGLRGRAQYHETTLNKQAGRIRLRGWQAQMATLAAITIITLGFVLPLIQLSVWSYLAYEVDRYRHYGTLLYNTVLLGMMVSILTVTAAMILAITQRHYRSVLVKLSVSIATIGYALPGSVLAVGMMLALISIDNTLSALVALAGWHLSVPILTSTIIALLLAHTARFLVVGYGPIDSSLQGIQKNLLEAAQGLGVSTGLTTLKIYAPLLKSGLLTAGLLVLVDVMKEMPATLLLRPLGWDTLSVKIYELTTEGEWERAALPSMMLIVASLLPMIIFIRRSARSS